MTCSNEQDRRRSARTRGFENAPAANSAANGHPSTIERSRSTAIAAARFIICYGTYVKLLVKG
jgi:hypothetical protein